MTENPLKWVTSVKHLGNHVCYDLSEKVEISHKQGDFISQVNGILTKFKMASKDVLMKVFNSYCCHYYGSQAWNSQDKYIVNFNVTWNKAMRRLWELPVNSHTVYLAGLNGGIYVTDALLYIFCKMYRGMGNSTNYIIVFLTKIAEGRRGLLGQNMSFVCRKWSVASKILQSGSVKHYRVFKDERVAHSMPIVELVRAIRESKQLMYNINGFTHDELNEIIRVATTREF